MVTRHLRSRRRARALATVGVKAHQAMPSSTSRGSPILPGHRRGAAVTGDAGRSIRSWTHAPAKIAVRGRDAGLAAPIAPCDPTAGAARRVGDHRAGRAQHLEMPLRRQRRDTPPGSPGETRRTPGATRRPRKPRARHREVSIRPPAHESDEHLLTTGLGLAGRHDPTEIAGAVRSAGQRSDVAQGLAVCGAVIGQSQVGSNPGPGPAAPSRWSR